MFSKIGLVAGLSVIVCAAGGSALGDSVYWTDKSTNIIYRGDRDGYGPHTALVTGLGEARGLGLDVVGGKMYWADAGLGKIQRANLDGSDIEDLVTGLGFLADVELDPAAEKIYWSQTFNGSIRRANFDGTEVEDIRTGLNEPYYFELHPAGGKIYWSELSNTMIHRMNIDGSGAIEDVVTGLVRVRDVGLDPSSGTLYWNDRNSHKIQRTPLDGSGPIEDIHTFIPDEGKPHGMALDPAAGMIYWTDTRTHWVMRGSMDGSGTPQILYDDSIGLDDPWDVELDIIPAEPTPGDTNGDGRVDDPDYFNLVAQFGGSPGLQSADFNNDGIVNLHDFAAMRGNFDLGLASAPNTAFGATIPEPATLSLLVLGGLAILRRARPGSIKSTAGSVPKGESI
ncbi:MAG: PEP-CTERM sorting domain-containing protein [Phycisphaerae bacterium]|jgi:low density lipoprotein receptor-related protein 5/6|nr:PEP-CTERM sorting domain-containing protein [Phycisphaerae bacterium]